MTRGEVVAIIPARGGSKGVPRKNLRRVGGIPLVGRAVASALASSSIDRVIVSTDDDEIAAVAGEWGAEVVSRPEHLSGDEASSESALLHALTVLRSRGINTSVLVLIQATSPFIDVDALDRAIEAVLEDECDSAFAAAETYGFLWRSDASGSASAVNHDADHRPRRQDRDPHYLETGAFYVLRADGFESARHRFFGRVRLVAVAERTAMEIDSEQDLLAARALAPLNDRPAPIDVDAVVTDFDGVHTDDTVIVDDAGHESVRVSRSDGMGISQLRSRGIPVLILSRETNAVVSARAQKLQIEVLQGIGDKAAALRQWAQSAGVPLHRIAYLGNDVNDLPALEIVGWPVAVPDAHPLVLAAARVVVTAPGGAGAVRELADRVLRARDPAAVLERRDAARRHEEAAS